MTESEKIRALAQYRLEQADEALQAAESNLDEGLTRSAVNRSYYAMSYAVLALLCVEKRETSRHSGAMSLFDQLFVKEGTIPKELSSWLHAAFALRQKVDYGTEPPPEPSETAATLEHARLFVAKVRERLPNVIARSMGPTAL